MFDSDLVASTSELLDHANEILLTTHVQPDGDAISSLLAAGHALQQLDKSLDLVCDDGLPSRFKFLPLSELIRKSPSLEKRYDLVIALDAADESRMGNAYALLEEPRPQILNIDHHITNTNFGLINVIDSEASSTTEVLFHFLPLLGIELTVDLSQCLLTGLVTDTLSFTTASVTPRSLEAASTLMKNGADLYDVSLQSLHLRQLSTLKIWNAGLSNVKIDDGLIWTVISDDERRRSGHGASSSFGLGNFMTNVYEANMSAVILELGDGRVSVGFRSRPPYDVSKIAVSLGGGGHALASGCTIDGPLQKAETLVLDRCRESINQQRRAAAEETAD